MARKARRDNRTAKALVTAGGREEYYVTQVWVVHVTDGDTVHVIPEGETKPVKVRLGGIDAPEMDQPFGEQSRDLLTTLAMGRELTLDVACTLSNPDCPGGPACTCTDIYGRLVGVLHDGNWKESVNKQMVESGMAYAWPTFGQVFGCHNAQRRARQKREGIWKRFGGEVRPWSHRHGGTQTPIEFMQAKLEAEAAEKAERKAEAEATT